LRQSGGMGIYHFPDAHQKVKFIVHGKRLENGGDG
jgi:hypothetical protein